jgi:hypothetical protein
MEMKQNIGRETSSVVKMNLSLKERGDLSYNREGRL